MSAVEEKESTLSGNMNSLMTLLGQMKEILEETSQADSSSRDEDTSDTSCLRMARDCMDILSHRWRELLVSEKRGYELAQANSRLLVSKIPCGQVCACSLCGRPNTGFSDRLAICVCVMHVYVVCVQIQVREQEAAITAGGEEVRAMVSRQRSSRGDCVVCSVHVERLTLYHLHPWIAASARQGHH